MIMHIIILLNIPKLPEGLVTVLSKYGCDEYGMIHYFLRVFVNNRYRTVAVIEKLLIIDN